MCLCLCLLAKEIILVALYMQRYGDGEAQNKPYDAKNAGKKSNSLIVDTALFMNSSSMHHTISGSLKIWITFKKFSLSIF